jgi:hypothetical protein
MILIQDLNGDNFKEIHLGEDKNSKKVTIKGTDFRAFPCSSIEIHAVEIHFVLSNQEV